VGRIKKGGDQSQSPPHVLPHGFYRAKESSVIGKPQQHLSYLSGGLSPIGTARIVIPTIPKINTGVDF